MSVLFEQATHSQPIVMSDQGVVDSLVEVFYDAELN